MPDNWLDRLEGDIEGIQTRAINWKSFIEARKDLAGSPGVLWLAMGTIESACSTVLRRINDAREEAKEKKDNVEIRSEG